MPPNKPTHTPGPWRRQYSDGMWRIFGAAGPASGLVLGIGDTMRTIPMPEDLALILAAPEMLEALQAILSSTQPIESPGLPLVEGMRLVRAAIAKATGC